MARLSLDVAGSVNALAFLDTIAWSEIGPTMLADPATDDGYKVLVGSRPDHLLLFQDYSHHPHVLNRKFNSTAAGRYQFIFGTWCGVSGELKLADFGPESQDRGALQLVFERGAMPHVYAGDIEQAVLLCNREWASLPDSPYGQRTNRMADLIAAFNKAREHYA